jgi:hypothetical protein
MVDGGTVALGPDAIEFANHVELGRVIISGLKILWFEQSVLVSKLQLLGHHLGASVANSKDGIVVNTGEAGSHVTCDDLRSARDHDRLLNHVTTLGDRLTGGDHHDRLAIRLLLDDALDGASHRVGSNGTCLDGNGNSASL